MGKQKNSKDIVYINEHLLCNKDIEESTCKFQYKALPTGFSEHEKILEQNVILFIIEGSCSFCSNQFSNRIFFAGDMIFTPKSSTIDMTILKSAKIVYMCFDAPQNTCDKQLLQHLWEISKKIDYDFAPLKMNYPMFNFINTLVYYLKNDVNCIHMHEAKHNELFLILRWFYSKEQFAEFFHPIIGESIDFRNFVLNNYSKCNRLEELIKLSNMCANAFMKKFKSEFGISGYQWMLKQMCIKIQHKALQPGVRIKDIMTEIGVSSPTHFNRICRRHFDKTPMELISFYQSKI